MEIRVEIKSVYGEEKIYPVCEQAKLFAQLANTKTLTPAALRLIGRLGYDIVPVKISGHLVAPITHAYTC